MKIFKLFFIGLLVASIIVLGATQIKMFKELDHHKVEVSRGSHQAAESRYMVEMLWQMLPDEIDRQVKDAVREELGQEPLIDVCEVEAE